MPKKRPAPASSLRLICHIGVRTRTWVSLCSAPFTFLSLSVNLSWLPSLSLRLCLSLSPSGAVSLFSKLCLCLCVSIWFSLSLISVAPSLLFCQFPLPSHRLVCFLTLSCSFTLSAALPPTTNTHTGVEGRDGWRFTFSSSGQHVPVEPFIICYLVMGTEGCGMVNFSFLTLLVCWISFSFFFLLSFFLGGGGEGSLFTSGIPFRLPCVFSGLWEYPTPGRG